MLSRKLCIWQTQWWINVSVSSLIQSYNPNNVSKNWQKRGKKLRKKHKTKEMCTIKKKTYTIVLTKRWRNQGDRNKRDAKKGFSPLYTAASPLHFFDESFIAIWYFLLIIHMMKLSTHTCWKSALIVFAKLIMIK